MMKFSWWHLDEMSQSWNLLVRTHLYNHCLGETIRSGFSVTPPFVAHLNGAVGCCLLLSAKCFFCEMTTHAWVDLVFIKHIRVFRLSLFHLKQGRPHSAFCLAKSREHIYRWSVIDSSTRGNTLLRSNMWSCGWGARLVTSGRVQVSVITVKISSFKLGCLYPWALSRCLNGSINNRVVYFYRTVMMLNA